MGLGKCSDLVGNAHCPIPALWQISRQREFEWNPIPKIPRNFPVANIFPRKIKKIRIFLVGIFRAGSAARAVATIIHQILDFGENGWWRLLQNCQEKIIYGPIIYGMLLSGGLGTRDRPGPLWDRKIGLNLILSRCFCS